MSGEYSEDRLVQKTTADYFERELGWESVYAFNTETFGEGGTLGRRHDGEVVLVRHLRRKLEELNPGHPDSAYRQAIDQLTAVDASKSPLQTNRALYTLVRDGVPVRYKTADGKWHQPRLGVIDFAEPDNNHFLVVRELYIQGPVYRRRPDLIGFVNGLPLLFIELKRTDKSVQVAYEENLSDYLDTIPHLFHHNALCMLSNGDEARVGTFTAAFDFFHPWKRLDEADPGVVDWQTMLLGLCDKRRFLDVVENYILFDDSPGGGTVKAMAANHQYLGVERAFTAVQDRDVRAGRLGVFWHTQGSGKSYSMVFLSQKVHRKLRGDFTFVILTDREDLDEQITNTFVGCGTVEAKKAAHATSGLHLKQLLQENHRFIFTLIQKFNQDDDQPYTERRDLIIIADEAHRTQYGKLAEAMRRVLPGASYIAFTGTPLMKSAEDQLTREIFGEYVSKYDFRQALEDGATVPLFYDNRGEKLALATADLNQRIAEEIEKHTLDPDQDEKLRRALGRDYHVLTADERLDRIARDLVAHLGQRWETGKAMLVTLDKLTAVRMHRRIVDHWATELDRQRQRLARREADAVAAEVELAGHDEDTRVRVRIVHQEKVETARAKLEWLESTEICVVVSESQGEVQQFASWGHDIVPHRAKIKQRDLDEEFKNPAHPFRLAIVCAMWLTGFDVPSLATLYLDKPMKDHTLMQAIARANRRAEGKNNGHIVDYNGVLRSLRAALAKYGEGEGAGGEGVGCGGDGSDSGEHPARELDALLADYIEAVERCETHLAECGFELKKLVEAVDFAKIALLSATNEASAVNAVSRSEETRGRFQILAREVFKKRKALVSEPELTKPYRRRADAIAAIYRKVEANQETADISQVMRALHGVVSEAITHRGPTRLPGAESGKIFDISHIDFDRLRREFARLPHQNTTLRTLQDAIDQRLRQMLRQNPLRMDFYRRYREIVDAYNRETDRVTIERTFEELMRFVGTLDDEARRAAREGLDEEHLAIFDLLVRTKGELATRQRNRVKQVAESLLEAIRAELAKLDHWKEKRQTQALVQTLIHDHLYDETTGLPLEVYNDNEVETLAEMVYLHVYQHYDGALEPPLAVAAGGEGTTASHRPVTAPSQGEDRTPAKVVPFPSPPLRRLAADEVAPFVDAVPILELEVAAGGFSDQQLVADRGEVEWVALGGRTRPAPGLFVAKVVGESMNRRIPSGAWCLWRANPTGTRSGKVILAQHRSIDDPETGGNYTVKRYQSEKVGEDGGGWRHSRIVLQPDSDDPAFAPLVFEADEAEGLRVVAELVEVLG